MEYNFWEFMTIDEIAKSQNLGPITNTNEIYGAWPGDIDDDFELLIRELRQP